MIRDYRLFIKDILDSIDRIEKFVGDMDFEEFVEDDKTSTAVVKKIEIIGEAIKNIPKDVKERYGYIPWRDIVRMRNKITHDYFGIDYEIVWNVVKEKLPGLRAQVEQVLKDIE
ncbi:MAG TPA: DUF86 domain-containing protein [Candidatus Methanoperedenaceae archaeon]|nr:DUF86 domain-containing protein [Candidatus Methanoperedenaceae archaeon]